MKLEDEIRQGKGFKSEKHKVSVNIVFTSNWMMDKMTHMLKPYNLNDQHFNVLRILRGQHPNSVCPGEIKDILINKRGDLTRLIDKLVKEGYVERSVNPENRRMVMNSITDKGLEILSELDLKFTYMDQFMANITDEEAKTLNDIIDKLRG